jgi:hypothetical protein
MKPRVQGGLFQRTKRLHGLFAIIAADNFSEQSGADLRLSGKRSEPPSHYGVLPSCRMKLIM